MKSIKFFGQRKTGMQWGTLVQIAQQGMIFVTVLNLFLLAATAYNTTLSAYFQARGIYISFLVFLAIIIGVMLAVGLWAWKFALPSFYSAFNDQFYKHNNLLRRDIEALKEDNAVSKVERKAILDKLEDLLRK